jgi:hypothetical protein
MSKITRVPGKKKGSIIERKTIVNRKLERQAMKNQLGNNNIGWEWSQRQDRRCQEAKSRLQKQYAKATDWTARGPRFAMTMEHALRCLSRKMRGQRGTL